MIKRPGFLEVFSDSITLAKPADSKSTPRESTVKNEAAAKADAHRGDFDPESNSTRTLAPVGTRRDDLDTKTDPVEPETAASKTRTSKNATPALGTFAENNQSRSRPTRSTDPAPAKRSHKKTATAAVPAQPAEPSDEESLHEGDDEDEEGEPRYCYCNEISFGEMVACDNDACPREWFHLSCVGLTKPPGKNGESLPCPLFSTLYPFFALGLFISDLIPVLTMSSQMVLQRMQGEYAPQSQWPVAICIEWKQEWIWLI